MKNLIALFAIIALLSSCAPVPMRTSVNTSCSGYLRAGLSRNTINEGGIGIMPVLGGAEREQYRRPMGEAIFTEFRNAFGYKVKPPNVVIELLNENNLTDDYTKAINNYTISGIVPKEMVQNLGKVLEVDYLLYTRLLSDSEYKLIPTGANSRTTVTVLEFYVQSQVWDTRIGDVVWEGKGGIAKLTNDDTDVVASTAQGLASVVGLAQYQGPCGTPNDIFKEIEVATSKILIGVFVITLFTFVLFVI